MIRISFAGRPHRLPVFVYMEKFVLKNREKIGIVKAYDTKTWLAGLDEVRTILKMSLV